MQLKPIHKLSLAGSVATALCALLVWAGYAWGASASRADERLLTPKQSKSAQQRMAAISAGSDEDTPEDEEDTRLSKTRYIAWLEQKVDELHSAAAKKTPPAPAQTPPAYSEFARLLMTAVQPTMQAPGPQRAVTSKLAVQVLTELWQEAHGEKLELPDDLFVRALEAPAPARPAGLPAARSTTNAATAAPDKATVKDAPVRELGVRSPAQVGAIRAAIAEFNAR